LSSSASKIFIAHFRLHPYAIAIFDLQTKGNIREIFKAYTVFRMHMMLQPLPREAFDGIQATKEY
jgi:hypothetical protein